MKVLVVNTSHPPYPGKYGSAIHIYSILKSLSKEGHDVHLVTINTDRLKVPDSIPVLENDLNISYKFFFPEDLANNGEKDPEHYYIGKNYTALIDDEISKFCPDHIFCFTLNSALAYNSKKHGIAHSVSVVDIDYLVKYYRIKLKRYTTIREWLYQKKRILKFRKLNKILVARLKKANVVFEHAAHHAEWLKNKGIAQTTYLPVNYYFDPHPKGFKSNLIPNEKLKISLIGDVNGIATIYGLFFLADEILPLLNKNIKLVEKLEINIYGGGTIDDRLKKKFDCFSNLVHLKGYVRNLVDIYENTDVLMIPTNIPLGFRTRIIEGFYYRMPVLAHKANTVAMPEFIHMVNGFEAKNAKDFVDLIELILTDRSILNQISEKAYKDYEQSLNGEVVGKRMVDYMEQTLNS